MEPPRITRTDGITLPDDASMAQARLSRNVLHQGFRLAPSASSRASEYLSP